jgi:hypothetical protein
MRFEIESPLRKEQWLLVSLMVVFLYRVSVVQAAYMDLMYTSLALLVTALVFLFIFNIIDGEEGKIHLGKIAEGVGLAIIAIIGLACSITFGSFLMLYFYATLIPYPDLLLLVTAFAGIFGVVITYVTVRRLWNLVKDWEFVINYRKDAAESEQVE